MVQDNVRQLADWLEANMTAILERKVMIKPTEIFAVLDSFAVLNNPVAKYLAITEETYYQSESDHKLTLSDDRKLLIDVTDRIMVTHVDGILADNKVNFEYSHEAVYEDQYLVKRDLEVLTYGLAVIGAVAATVKHNLIQADLSKDAVLSLALAAQNIANWQAK
ncbi:hypothetical protein [Latilactobacillus fuchuensis]|uniref:Uncharacterized protein n=2 Tax=Latilactobacillus fuchuensis TaxID=164393 RepID=A0A2N9DSZ4_9LACO|nr:hypothetical protein [Latilactobacillus fuchuensis]KRL61988.1 hypothetical protein FC69_GL001198 [Latilactobacillus fuchuensis DSM 14340 = JCM 11249]MCP8856696.1 hypothetical protein [Latilactobacillus fuchuensis]SPC35873.1 conserved hypothetical protein [Latilactobacillus fuchuensis]